MLFRSFPFISSSHSFSPNSAIPLPHLFPSVAQPSPSLFDFPPTNASPSLPQVTISNDSHGPIETPSSSFQASDDFPIPVSAESSALTPSPSIQPSIDLPNDISADSSHHTPIPIPNPSAPLRKSSRVHKPPAYLNDFK